MRGLGQQGRRVTGNGLAPDRREFQLLLAALGASLGAVGDAWGHLTAGDEFAELIPPEDKFSAEWLAKLPLRGEPEWVDGEDLKYIGMPVGGIAAGAMYLGGDGRLWLWDVFNRIQEGIDPKTVEYAGQQVPSRDGSAYVAPPEQIRPVDQGFLLEIEGAEGTTSRRLDGTGFREVRFLGQYPIGSVVYRDDDSPVSVTLEAFSPFVPLDAEDSALPATVLSFSVANVSQQAVNATLTGWLENAICLHHRQRSGARRNEIVAGAGFTFLNCTATAGDGGAGDGGPLESLFDFGSMGLALMGEPAEHRAADRTLDGTANEHAERPLSESLVGEVGRRIELRPGETVVVSFVVTWHFPNLTLLDTLKGRRYAARFVNAQATAAYVAQHFERLASTTRLWRDTWNDSTLPHWFLNRTFANTSTLATSTCHWLADGRFWAWEGVGSCPGTCIHVWHYAQAMGRLFPQLERELREQVDFGMAFDANSGVIRYRGEFGDWFAVDGQCGTILRAYREHQMSPDDAFLRRIWPRVKHAMQRVMEQDGDRTGIVRGPMHNTLDADWYGVVPWLVGMYHAALRACEVMSREMGDEVFARKCRELFERGVVNLDKECWNEEFGYFVQRGDPKFLDRVGSYDGCHIDQVLGQAWAWQVGIGRVGHEQHTRKALQSLWRYSVAPDVGPYREVHRAGRWYAMPGDGGLLMVTHPFGERGPFEGANSESARYFNECMSGFEWQAAAHMIWEGMTTEGLAVARLIHDRYQPRKRNPYNEIECSDHYARAMASYGAYLAACGFEHHGPRGHIAFAPRIGADEFRAAFTTAEGWGTFAQQRRDGQQVATLEPKYGSVRCRTFGLMLPENVKAASVTAALSGEPVAASIRQEGAKVTVTFAEPVDASAGETLKLTVAFVGSAGAS